MRGSAKGEHLVPNLAKGGESPRLKESIYFNLTTKPPVLKNMFSDVFFLRFVTPIALTGCRTRNRRNIEVMHGGSFLRV